jgi:hypothetical protein
MSIAGWLFAATPTPDPSFDPDTVTPTWIGFAVTFLVALAVVVLMVDMTRRVRRVRYRSEVREQLEVERAQLEAEAAENPPKA